ncbi:DDE-type integrase/transposase/recombinase [Paracoccus aminophilus]|nr:DDE-type integrase/transposase/recombinase [Paracoccus aminophilus]
MTMFERMPMPRATHHLLECEAELIFNGRCGTVFEVRPEASLIAWKEFFDLETGEVHAARSSALTHEDAARADREGRLAVTRRPGSANAVGRPSRFDRSPEEIRRMEWRKSYVLASDALVSSGAMRPSRTEFERCADEILAAGETRDLHTQMQKNGYAAKRGGASVEWVRLKASPKSAAIIRRWYLAWKRGGDDALFDNLRASGRRGTRMLDEERAFMWSVIEMRLDLERPSISSIVDSVQTAFDVHNQGVVPGTGDDRILEVPGYDAIWSAINEIAPLDHAIRTRGLKIAYRDMHGVGIGIETTRALERVEIDEYTMDLMVLFRKTGILELLSDDIVRALGLDGSAKRVVLSAAIDVHTRCIVGIKLGKEASARLMRDTVEMIYTEKTPITDGIAEMDWPMYGRPGLIAMDRGAAYVADETYDLLAAAGITNFGAPAGKPWLRGFIERLFRTIHSKLLQRFSGRTFSDVVQRGENNHIDRASVTLEDLLGFLTRWIVDIYHLEPHRGLNGMSPYEAWMEATANLRPAEMSRREMRHVFGIKDKRKYQKSGFRVFHLDYMSDELHALNLREAEIAWWPGDISAIEVKVGPDRWLTVPVTDPKWIGKTHIDHTAWLMSRRERNREHEAIANRAKYALDVESYRRKQLSNLLPTIMTAHELRLEEERHRRYLDTASRRMNSAEPRDLFADEVETEIPPQGEISSTPPVSQPNADNSAPRHPEVPGDDDTDDLMD